MEKLAGDLLLGLKFVKLEILSTSFIDFLYDELGELRSRSLGLSNLHSVHKSTHIYARVIHRVGVDVSLNATNAPSGEAWYARDVPGSSSVTRSVLDTCVTPIWAEKVPFGAKLILTCFGIINYL